MGTSRLTILFDDPFWIGLYEREDDTEYSVCRIVFGAEPRDQEVYAYLLEHWRTLRFSPPRPGTEHLPPSQKPQAAPAGGPADDPGRRDRHQGPAGPEAPTGAGEAGPSARTRQQREAEEARKFQLRQARRKKHRGH